MKNPDELTKAKLQQLEVKLRKEYRRAANEARKRATEYFDTLEARFQQEFEAYQRGEYTAAQFNDWYLTQVKRGEGYQRMADDLAKRVVECNKVASAYINDTTPSIFALNYNYSAYEISQAYGGVYGNVSFQLFDEQAVRELIEGKNHVEFRTTRINPIRDYKWNRGLIESALTAGIMQGKPIDKLADSFMAVMERNRSSAVRNARTAVTSAQNGGRLESYRRASKMGIELQKEWMATFDDRTRDSHADLDGERVDYDDKFSNGLKYPADPDGIPAEVYNCRCTMRAILPDINDEARETFDEWANRMRANEPYLTDRERRKAGKILNTKLAGIEDNLGYFGFSDAAAILKRTGLDVGKTFNTENFGVVENILENYTEFNRKYPIAEALIKRDRPKITVVHDYSRTKEMIKTSARLGRSGVRLVEIEINKAGVNNLIFGSSQTMGAFTEIMTAGWHGSGSRLYMPCAKEYYDKYMAAHEYGHILQYSIISRDINFKAIRAGDIEDAYNSAVKEMYDELNRIIKRRGYDGDAVLLLSNYATGELKKGIYTDAFAEAFANMECGAPNIWGDAMRDYLHGKGIL